MMIDSIVLSFGYCESVSTSFVCFITPNEFDNESDAFKSLIQNMYQAFKEIHPNRIKQQNKTCCNESQSRSANYCSHCGSMISYETFDFDLFEEFISSLCAKTMDDIGSFSMEDWHFCSIDDMINSIKYDSIASLSTYRFRNKKCLFDYLEEDDIDGEDIESFKRYTDEK